MRGSSESLKFVRNHYLRFESGIHQCYCILGGLTSPLSPNEGMNWHSLPCSDQWGAYCQWGGSCRVDIYATSQALRPGGVYFHWMFDERIKKGLWSLTIPVNNCWFPIYSMFINFIVCNGQLTSTINQPTRFPQHLFECHSFPHPTQTQANTLL